MVDPEDGNTAFGCAISVWTAQRAAHCDRALGAEARHGYARRRLPGSLPSSPVKAPERRAFVWKIQRRFERVALPSGAAGVERRPLDGAAPPIAPGGTGRLSVSP